MLLSVFNSPDSPVPFFGNGGQLCLKPTLTISCGPWSKNKTSALVSSDSSLSENLLLIWKELQMLFGSSFLPQRTSTGTSLSVCNIQSFFWSCVTQSRSIGHLVKSKLTKWKDRCTLGPSWLVPLTVKFKHTRSLA